MFFPGRKKDGGIFDIPVDGLGHFKFNLFLEASSKVNGQTDYYALPSSSLTPKRVGRTMACDDELASEGLKCRFIINVRSHRAHKRIREF